MSYRLTGISRGKISIDLPIPCMTTAQILLKFSSCAYSNCKAEYTVPTPRLNALGQTPSTTLTYNTQSILQHTTLFQTSAK
ncbi:hypothetical protein KC19_2G136000 [Ceratodon purpureus]|uniref:Uncharacterized protein n=1 Tax=Ceratodon purpureus TaxID=3225 RepID=A0A8T0IV49_CERPU|nr:hypothetical protein KC19_2G136000 [Ceratodon purpureus]